MKQANYEGHWAFSLPSQTAAACNQLSAFINQVQAFINSGGLTQADGQSLIDAANSIKISLGC